MLDKYRTVPTPCTGLEELVLDKYCRVGMKRKECPTMPAATEPTTVLVEALVKYLITALIPQPQQGEGREWRQGLPYSRYAAATLAAAAKRTAPNTSGLAP